MDENNQTRQQLPTLDEANRQKPPTPQSKKAHSVNVNGREVFVAYRTLRKQKEVK